jgi:hypothetical protein
MVRRNHRGQERSLLRAASPGPLLRTSWTERFTAGPAQP